MKRLRWWLLPLVLVSMATAYVAWTNLGGEEVVDDSPALPSTTAQVERGAYLARAGNCATCHTQRGGAPYAGGRPLVTPFGTVYSSNLTADPEHGLGRWNAGHFWRALHHGRSRDGHLLNPAFPYNSTSRLTREDSDALFAYLRTVPSHARANTPHDLRWPYGTPLALAVWRTLYFRPGETVTDGQRSAEWNRGAYLVHALGHCGACHAPRDALGAIEKEFELGGGQLAMQNWYAPSLRAADEASVATWSVDEIVLWLRGGFTARGHASGPMAEVVQGSTQYLNDADLRAMATYLRSLPSSAGASPAKTVSAPGQDWNRGQKIYQDHCETCHGTQGQGVPGAYPALAGNRAVTMAVTSNLVQSVLYGGFAPSTVANPRPFGMPPYVLQLSDDEVAAVLTYIRNAWGQRASPVSAFEVSRQRER